MGVFLDTVGFLVAQVPEISSLQARLIVNHAWSDIRSEKERWSFLTVETHIRVPDQVTAGTVTTVQDSDQVTADATAKAALDAIGNTALIGRVFRLAAGLPIYVILNYDSTTGILTLDRTFYEASVSGSTYLIYQPFVTAPVLDFVRWISVKDPIDGYPIQTGFTKRELDERDPYRSAVGDQPVILAAHVHNDANSPRYEWWPHPTVRRQYGALYRRKGVDLTDAIDPPAIIPRDLLLDRALYRAYEWGEANKQRFPDSLGGPNAPNWAFLMGKVDKSYRERMMKVKNQDDEIYNQQWGSSWIEDSFGYSEIEQLQQRDYAVFSRFPAFRRLIV